MDNEILNILINDSKDISKIFLKQYIEIIDNAIKENRKRYKKDDIKYVYYEEHHILPKSIYIEHKNNKVNKVLLLPKEHFICHRCLCEIFPGKQMAYAFYKMACCNTQKGILKLTEEEYEEARNQISKHPMMLGISPSEETKQLLSKTLKEYWSNKTRNHTKEQDKKMVETRKKNGSYKQTPEQRKAKSDATKGRIYIHKDDKNKMIVKEDLDDYLAMGWIRGKKPYSEEHKKHIGEATRRMWEQDGFKDYWSQKYSGENNPFFGKHHTEETKKLIKDKRKERVKNNECK